MADITYTTEHGVHIAYRVVGDGVAPVLYIPDGLVTIESTAEEPHYARFLDELGRFARVALFDRRGIGLSDPFGVESPSLEVWADDAIRVLDDLGWDRAHVIGVAEGGFVATMVAAIWPARVNGLVLLNSTASFDAQPDADVVRAELHGLSVSAARNWGENVSAIPRFAPSVASDPEFRQWLRRTIRRAMSPGTAQRVFDVQFGGHLTGLLPSIGVPTLVVHRADNAYLPPTHGCLLAQSIPGATYVEVPGADHAPYIGDTQPIVDAVESFVLGTATGTDPTRALSTVLVSDIVGSTSIAAELGDANWKRLLDEHDRAVRRRLALHRGIEAKQTGDGFLATFDGPARAIRCALEMVDEVAALGVEIRVGVHAGEIEHRGSDVGGLGVHIAARIAAEAGPKEVLASRTVTDLVAGSGLHFEDKGDHVLRGVPGTWRLFAASGQSPIASHRN